MKPSTAALRRILDGLVGGLIPSCTGGRTILTVSTEYEVRIVWFRRSITIEYSSPRIPRAARRVRAADDVRTHEYERRKLAGEPLVQVGDVVPRYAIGYVKHIAWCRDAAGGQWRYAGDGRWSQGDAWVTDEGLLELGPLTVLAVSKPSQRTNR